jgi:hypothetical protein
MHYLTLFTNSQSFRQRRDARENEHLPRPSWVRPWMPAELRGDLRSSRFRTSSYHRSYLSNSVSHHFLPLLCKHRVKAFAAESVQR